MEGFSMTVEIKQQIWDLYWLSDLTAREIKEAYGIAKDVHVGDVCGPAYIGQCARCRTGLLYHSRNAALSLKSHCQACREIERLAASEKALDEQVVQFRKQKEKQEQTPPKTNYNEYLKSEWWNTIRQHVLARYDHQCQICSSPKYLNVHHRTYDRLGREAPNDLIVLCQNCHEIFHSNGRLVRSA